MPKNLNVWIGVIVITLLSVIGFYIKLKPFFINGELDDQVIPYLLLTLLSIYVIFSLYQLSDIKEKSDVIFTTLSDFKSRTSIQLEHIEKSVINSRPDAKVGLNFC